MNFLVSFREYFRSLRLLSTGCVFSRIIFKVGDERQSCEFRFSREGEKVIFLSEYDFLQRRGLDFACCSV